jgi:hypothetical protein
MSSDSSSKPASKNQLYMRIARSCLQAINASSAKGKSQQDSVSEVYEAIDLAFKAETTALIQELNLKHATLTQISQLDPALNTLQDAIDLASNKKNQTH